MTVIVLRRVETVEIGRCDSSGKPEIESVQ